MSHVGITLLLAALTMVGPLAIDTYLPSFPAMAADLAADPIAVQQTLSIFGASLAFMMLFYGTLSDTFGRRPVILVSLVLFVIASIAAAMAPTIGWLLVARCFQGLAAGAGSIVGRAIVQDRFSGAAAHRVMSHMMMVFGVAPALAPVIGGWLQVGFGWRSIFWFLAATAALLWVAVWRGLPESLPVERRQPLRLRVILANYGRVLRHRRFMTMAVAGGISFAGVSLYVGSAASFVMNILKLPETAFAWLFVPMVMGLMTGSALGPRLLVRTSPDFVIRAGFGAMLFAALVNVSYNALFTPAVPWAVLPIMLNSFGLSLASPGMTLRIQSIFPEIRGMAASVQGFLHMLSFSLISGLVAPLLFHEAALIATGHLVAVLVALTLWTLGARGVKAPR